MVLKFEICFLLKTAVVCVVMSTHLVSDTCSWSVKAGRLLSPQTLSVVYNSCLCVWVSLSLPRLAACALGVVIVCLSYLTDV